ncbi:nitroreductase [Candidatus Dojkabacteria bacterium]|nr:nitroreductase [Candidatus Dojkabacteria bacterium]
MDILQTIRNRRSIRQFKDKKISDDILHKVLEAARWAPSAVNRQPWNFIVIKKESIKKKLSGKLFSAFISRAPIVIAICAKIKKSKWAVIDCSLAAQNIMLEAHSLGLGTCFVGAFNEQKVKDILRIPKGIKVIGLITLGYPTEKKRKGIRLELDSIVSFNTYQNQKGNFFDKGLTSFVKKKISSK